MLVQDIFGGTGTINRMNQSKKLNELNCSLIFLFSRLEDETRDFPESPKNVENGQYSTEHVQKSSKETEKAREG